MTRDLDAQVDGVVLYAAEMLEINLDADDVTIWTGSHDLTWNGKTWLGVGTMLSIGPVREQTALDNHRVRVVLSGIPQSEVGDLIAELDTDPPVGRTWTRYLASFDENGTLCSVDTMDAGQCGAVDFTINPVEDGGGIDMVSAISMTLESEAACLSRKHHYRLDDAMQQNLWAGDLGLEFVTDLNDEINWGSAPPGKVGGGGGGMPGLEGPGLDLK